MVMPGPAQGPPRAGAQRQSVRSDGDGCALALQPLESAVDGAENEHGYTLLEFYLFDAVQLSLLPVPPLCRSLLKETRSNIFEGFLAPLNFRSVKIEMNTERFFVQIRRLNTTCALGSSAHGRHAAIDWLYD